jgi:hypothetical protein
MLRTDFENHVYTAEVLRISRNGSVATDAIEGLLTTKWQRHEISTADGRRLLLLHGFVGSKTLGAKTPFHRASRTRTTPEGTDEQIPRSSSRHGFLYDVLLVQDVDRILIAVPFHSLAEKFFVRVDRQIAGTKTVYEKLNITRIVIHLAGEQRDGDESEIGITKCQLVYEDPEAHRRDLQSIRLIGTNLRRTEIYQQLIGPVLRPREDVNVTPNLLGFAAFVGGAKFAGAVTDQYGNFKVHVGPGLRRVVRIFDLLDEIERIKGATTTTSNIPILQGQGIEDESA